MYKLLSKMILALVCLVLFVTNVSGSSIYQDTNIFSLQVVVDEDVLIPIAIQSYVTSATTLLDSTDPTSVASFWDLSKEFSLYLTQADPQVVRFPGGTRAATPIEAQEAEVALAEGVSFFLTTYIKSTALKKLMDGDIEKGKILATIVVSEPVSLTFLSFFSIPGLYIKDVSPTLRNNYLIRSVSMSGYIMRELFHLSSIPLSDLFPGITANEYQGSFLLLDNLASSLTSHLDTVSTEEEYVDTITERDLVFTAMQAVGTVIARFHFTLQNTVPADSTNTMNSSLFSLYPSGNTRLIALRATPAFTNSLLTNIDNLPVSINPFSVYKFTGTPIPSSSISPSLVGIDIILFTQFTPIWKPSTSSEESTDLQVNDRYTSPIRSIALMSFENDQTFYEIQAVVTPAFPVKISIPLPVLDFRILDNTGKYKKFCEMAISAAQSNNPFNDILQSSSRISWIFKQPTQTTTPCVVDSLDLQSSSASATCKCSRLSSGVFDMARFATYFHTAAPSTSGWVPYNSSSIKENPLPTIIVAILTLLFLVMMVVSSYVDHLKDTKAIQLLLEQWPLKKFASKSTSSSDPQANSNESESESDDDSDTESSDALPGFFHCVWVVGKTWLSDLTYPTSWLTRHPFDPITSMSRSMAAVGVILAAFASLAVLLGSDAGEVAGNSNEMKTYGIFSSLIVAGLVALGITAGFHLILAFVLYLLFGDNYIRKFIHKYSEETALLLHVRAQTPASSQAKLKTSYFTQEECDSLLEHYPASDEQLGLGIFAIAEYAQWDLTAASEILGEAPPVRDVRSLSYLLRGVFALQIEHVKKVFSRLHGGFSRSLVSTSHVLCLFLLIVIAAALCCVILLYGTQIGITRSWTIGSWVGVAVLIFAAHCLVLMPILVFFFAFLFVLGYVVFGLIPFSAVADKPEYRFGIPVLTAHDQRFKHLHGALQAISNDNVASDDKKIEIRKTVRGSNVNDAGSRPSMQETTTVRTSQSNAFDEYLISTNHSQVFIPLTTQPISQQDIPSTTEQVGSNITYKSPNFQSLGHRNVNIIDESDNESDGEN